MKEEKEYYIELLRVIAIFFVIFNHTRNMGYMLYTEVESGFTYWASLSVSIFCKIAVPIFFMISGGLLLRKQETLKQLFDKRILRFVIVILLFTFLQYLRIVRVHPENGFHLSTWLQYCYSGNIIEPYWFLKSYLSMLLILPFMRPLVSVMGKREYLFLIGVKVIATIIALIFTYTGYAANLSFPFHDDIIFYPLMGYFLVNVMEQKDSRFWQTKSIAVMLPVCLLLIVLQANAFFQSRGGYVDNFHSIYTWILASLLFLLVKGIRIQSPMVQKLICAMGSCTFGIYLIEDVARNQVQRIMPTIVSLCGRFWAGIIFTVLSFWLAMIAIYIVRKIPFVRKLI